MRPSRGLGWAPSCRPGDGRAVFLGLHPQRSYAGRLAIGINVEVIAVDSPADPGAPKQAAHVCLSHVAAAWTGHAQEVGDASGSVRVRRHAGRDGVAWHHAAWHRGGCTAAPDPRRVLDLEGKGWDYDLVLLAINSDNKHGVAQTCFI